MLHAANAVSGIPGRRQMERRHRNMAQGYQPTAAAPAPAASLIADPAPLGLAGFGFTTLLLSLINAKILPATLTVLVMSMALAFGGLGQLVAGMWEFKRGNTFAATAFTAYGAFWISFYLLVVVFVPLLPKTAAVADIDNFVGWYLLGWGIFTAYMFLASLAGARSVQLVFFLLAATFILLAIGKFATSDGISQVGGFVGLATTAAAVYTSFADVANANFKRRVLPT
jgi:succinate-acetate transporter protein